MKALIFFDGTPTSFKNLQAACAEATLLQERQAGKAQSEQCEALLLTFECVTHPTELPTAEQHARSLQLLQQAVQKLERYAEFDGIKGEIISCLPAEVTDRVLDRAQEWGATTIFMPLHEREELTAVNEVRWWRRWWKIADRNAAKKARPKPSQPRPGFASSTSCVIIQLVEEAPCRVILTDREGMTLKIGYYNPTRPAPTRQLVSENRDQAGLLRPAI